MGSARGNYIIIDENPNLVNQLSMFTMPIFVSERKNSPELADFHQVHNSLHRIIQLLRRSAIPARTVRAS